MIIVVDFGSQTTHLIARRIKDLGVETKIINPQEVFSQIKREKPKGIVLSGGPSSVYAKCAPTINKTIYSLNIPILGICYGLQLTTKLLGGKVISGKKEYGPTKLKIHPANGGTKVKIAKDLPESFTVWMSHGDEVIKLPKGFRVLGTTANVPFAFVENKNKKIFGLQFHPEVEHTENGLQILRNFIEICGLKAGSKAQGKLKIQNAKFKIEEIENKIKKTVGDNYVIGAVSGGVDSTVAGILTAKAISKKFFPIYVENGLMREGTRKHVIKIFKQFKIKPVIVNVEKDMLKKLRGIINPEKKRKIIGGFYIKVFEEQMLGLIKKGKKVKFLLQGTIYSDVIESKGSKHADKIKSHHNVGGLPKNMKLKLLEPLRYFYKDEVRAIGRKLGLPEEFIYQQPFPGPGYAIRIRGKINKERLKKEKMADKIVLEELKKADILKNVFLSFPVLTNTFSTAVKGDERFFGEVVAVRIVESQDVMTSTWARLPYDILQKISSRIVNEVPRVSRVVYDITTKPPATMEWE